MKLSKDMHENILLEGFETLKSDYEENATEISEIIGKMAAIDIDIAMDMWEHVLVANPKLVGDNAGYINDNKAYAVTSKVLYNINEKIGESAAAKAIISRHVIIEAIFGKSANVDGNQCCIINYYILQGDLVTADEILQLVIANKNNEGKGFSLTIGEIFQNIIDKLRSYKNKSEDKIEFIQHWIQQIEDPKEKAKANVRFLDLL